MRVEVSGAQRDIAVVIGLVVLLGLPHLLLGPSITADDWVWIRNGEFLGWWDAGGERQIGRPGAYLLYAVTFGLVGPHPLVHALVQVALWAAAAVAVLLALREVLDARLALVVTAVWLLAPTHTTLELWASTSQAWVAVGLLAVGARQIARAARGEAALWPALVALGSAGAFYEVAIVAAPVVAVLVDRHVGGAWSRRIAVAASLAVVPVLAWSLATATVYSNAIGSTEHLWLEHLAAPLSMGVPVDSRGVAGLVVLVAVAAAAVVYLRWRDTRVPTVDVALVVAGAALVVAGTLPALRSYAIPFGMGDRLTAVSGLGAALFWTGALRAPLKGVDRGVRLAAVLVVLIPAAAERAGDLEEWVAVGDAAAETAAQLASDASASRDGLLVVEGPIAADTVFYGIYDGWSGTAAAQLVANDPTLVVQVDIRCVRSGPLAGRRLEQYGERPDPTIPGCPR